jgi:DNA-binding NarL/FixJ family response regulator
MHSGGPRGGIRVVCLYAGGVQRPAPGDILESADGLEYLGDCDMALAPFEHVRSLKPHVVILHLPLPALDVLRWINYLRTALDHCGILVTAPAADPDNRRRVLASGADDFIAADEFEQRLLPAIRSSYRKHFRRSSPGRP